MIIIDAENCVLGRMLSRVAKKVMEGEEVAIINADKAVITGEPSVIVQQNREKFEIRDIAKPVKSPKLSRRPDLYVKRAIRGMFPRKSRRGVLAERRVLAYIGVPKEFEGKKAEKMFEVTDAHMKKITVNDLCRQLGWKG